MFLNIFCYHVEYRMFSVVWYCVCELCLLAGVREYCHYVSCYFVIVFLCGQLISWLMLLMSYWQVSVTPAMTPMSPNNPFEESSNPFEHDTAADAQSSSEPRVEVCLLAVARSSEPASLFALSQHVNAWDFKHFKPVSRFATVLLAACFGCWRF